jgi:hypothetical protein
MNAINLLAGSRTVKAPHKNGVAITMPKSWQDLTEVEKIEDLRRDIVRIFDVLNALVADVRNNHAKLNEFTPKVNLVSEEVSRLTGQLPKD